MCEVDVFETPECVGRI